jgi:chromosome segregation ATPase
MSEKKKSNPGRQPFAAGAEHVLDWFRKTHGPSIEREARDAEVTHNARAAAVQRWHDAEARKAELAELRREIEDASAEYRAVVHPAAVRVAKARRAYGQLEGSIQHAQRRAELLLRDTNPIVRDSSAILWALFDARRHLHAHMTSEVTQMRERKRDAGSAARSELTDAIKAHDEAAKLLPPIEDAIKRLERVQLTVAPDLEALLDEVTEGLPAECSSCGARLLPRTTLEDAIARGRRL